MTTPDLSVSDVSANEGNAGTTTFSFTVSLSSPAQGSGVTFDIATADNSAASPSDFTAKSLHRAVHRRRQLLVHVQRVVNGDGTTEPDEQFFVNVTSVSGANVADGQGTGTILNDDSCGLTYTPIYSIQGSGTTAAMTGTETTKGVIVGDFEGPTNVGLQGFFIQDVSGDGNTATSDGLFVFRGNTDSSLDVGDVVRVTGNVSEFNARHRSRPPQPARSSSAGRRHCPR